MTNARRFLRILLVVILCFVAFQPVHARQLIVGKSGAPYRTIQSAINAARRGDTIVVEAGTYQERITLKCEVTLQGAGKNRTILTYGGRDPVVTAKDVSSGAMTGFSIRYTGSANTSVIDIDSSTVTISGCEVIGGGYHGIIISGTSTVNVSDCSVHGNGQNGAVAWGGRLTVTGCDIGNNEYNGVAATQGAEVTIEDCTLHHNLRTGFHYDNRAKGSAVDNDVFLNTNGAAITQLADPVIERNTFRANEKFGIIVQDRGRGSVLRSTFYNNGSSGILVKGESNTSIEYNTLVSNDENGLFILEGSAPTIIGNIIAYNGETGIDTTNPGYADGKPAEVRYNNVWGNEAGDYERTSERFSNISEDPRFRDAENDDFRPLPDSPCIGAGEGGSTLGALDPVPLSELIVASGLVFSEDLDEENNAVGATSSFPHDTENICLSFSILSRDDDESIDWFWDRSDPDEYDLVAHWLADYTDEYYFLYPSMRASGPGRVGCCIKARELSLPPGKHNLEIHYHGFERSMVQDYGAGPAWMLIEPLASASFEIRPPDLADNVRDCLAVSTLPDGRVSISVDAGPLANGFVYQVLYDSALSTTEVYGQVIELGPDCKAIEPDLRLDENGLASFETALEVEAAVYYFQVLIAQGLPALLEGNFYQSTVVEVELREETTQAEGGSGDAEPATEPTSDATRSEIWRNCEVSAESLAYPESLYVYYDCTGEHNTVVRAVNYGDDPAILRITAMSSGGSVLHEGYDAVGPKEVKEYSLRALIEQKGQSVETARGLCVIDELNNGILMLNCGCYFAGNLYDVQSLFSFIPETAELVNASAESPIGRHYQRTWVEGYYLAHVCEPSAKEEIPQADNGSTPSARCDRSRDEGFAVVNCSSESITYLLEICNLDGQPVLQSDCSLGPMASDYHQLSKILQDAGIFSHRWDGLVRIAGPFDFDSWQKGEFVKLAGLNENALGVAHILYSDLSGFVTPEDVEYAGLLFNCRPALSWRE